MKISHSSLLPLLLPLLLLLLISIPSTTSQTCQRSCGKLPVKYPFGTGPGCGDPRFQNYVTCKDQQQLTYTTHTGTYPITSIDYNNQMIFVTDPSMSTCSCTQPSKGFGLDWNAPFSFHDNTIFALLDCSTTGSPLYRSNDTSAPLCDPKGAPICNLLYSCQAISRLNMPISTCCVYAPVDLGPSFEMDLQKMQCSSYSGLYSFSEKQSDPESWEYGVALKYKFNFNNDYPTMCANCEKSKGACGYSGSYDSFVCNCPTGLNTTTDCYYGSWNNGLRILPWQSGSWMIFSLAWLLLNVLL